MYIAKQLKTIQQRRRNIVFCIDVMQKLPNFPLYYIKRWEAIILFIISVDVTFMVGCDIVQEISIYIPLQSHVADDFAREIALNTILYIQKEVMSFIFSFIVIL